MHRVVRAAGGHCFSPLFRRGICKGVEFATPINLALDCLWASDPGQSNTVILAGTACL